MKINREKTQSELDTEIQDSDGACSAEQAAPDPPAPLETTVTAAQLPPTLIGDHVTTDTTIEPVC
jgi:hypothetical protein